MVLEVKQCWCGVVPEMKQSRSSVSGHAVCMQRSSRAVQVIGRMGKWLYSAMSQSHLMHLPPEGLLGAGWWPGAAQRDFQHCWHPRFCIEVPEELVDVVFPILRRFAEVHTVY